MAAASVQSACGGEVSGFATPSGASGGSSGSGAAGASWAGGTSPKEGTGGSAGTPQFDAGTHTGGTGSVAPLVDAGAAPPCPLGTERYCALGGTTSCVCASPTDGGLITPDQCASPAQYFCGYARAGADFACWCDSSAPKTASDCAHTEQFQCEWYPEPQSCWCDASAPLTAADCGPCTYFYCHSYDPQVGCECMICIR